MLNSHQQHIIENGDGVVIIKAGPGTGKTKTLASRIAYLIKEKNVHPENILILTFTKRAAAEMQSRLSLILNSPTITTFHSWAFDFLSSKIGEIKIEKETDFDKLILDTYQYLIEHPEECQALQEKYQYILIDEFQDTNDIQYQIIKLILKENPNLFIIGDPHQSIYGFRDAKPAVFETLKFDFPQSKEETFEINYRSKKHLVEISNQLFPGTKLMANTKELGQAALIKTLNEYAEAEWIVRFINSKIGGTSLLAAEQNNEPVTFADFAVIYRTHNLSHILEKKLGESGMPYQIIKEDTPVEGDHIKLLSMHAAKGLEFKYVFICGFEEGLIPYVIKDTDLEEEKRLLYVGMTRAKEELYLLSANKRHGNVKKISRFRKLINHPAFKEIEDENTEKIKQRIAKSKLQKSQISLF